MTFSLRVIIRRLLAPRHKLSISPTVWERLCADLRGRGNNATRESGAFLLGNRDVQSTRIADYILYDDLDPRCLDTGIVRFNGRYFEQLWNHCAATGLTVIADVHVHPGGSDQSNSDKNHPMISQVGHIALILANFAEHPVRLKSTGIYTYLGKKQWRPVPANERAQFFHIGF